MPKKNLIVFIVLSLVVYIGWIPLQNWIWPRKPRLQAPPEIHLPERSMWSTLPLQAAPLNPGLGNAFRVAADLAVLGNWSADEKLFVAVKPPEPVVKEPEPPKIVLPKVKSETVTLGSASEDSRFNLEVVFTTRGGGIQSLVLNKFPRADRLGKPDGNPPRRLEMIRDDADNPSNLLLHYAPTTESHPNFPEGTLGQIDWAVSSRNLAADADVQQVVFSTELPREGVAITKTYTLEKGTYHVGLTVRIESKKEKPGPFRYQLTGAHGLPIEGEWYTTNFRNSLIGRGPKGDVHTDRQTSLSVGIQNGGSEVVREDDKIIRFAGIANQYFASVLAVDEQQDDQKFLAWARPTREGPNFKDNPNLDDITVRVISEPIELKKGVPVEHKYLLYNGPVKVMLLGQLDGEKHVEAKLVQRYIDPQGLALNRLTDFGSYGWWTTILISCTNLMHGVLYFLHSYIMPWNYGLCIILLTLLVRGIMFPVSRRQALASAKMQEKMAELAPEKKKIEEKFKNDPMESRKAINELYLKKGVNPLAMMGSCWIVFAQMPIFLGLYYALQESIHLRLAPFLWMDSLAAPDMLFWWGENIPIVSKQADLGFFKLGPLLGPFFCLLPIITVGLMIAQQAILTPPPTDEQQAMQQKMMKYMMLVFGVMFYKVASGLCVYWIISSMWGLAERKLLPKKQPAAAGGPAAGGKDGPGPRRPPPPRGKGGPRTNDGSKPNGEARLQKVKNMWAEILKEARKK